MSEAATTPLAMVDAATRLRLLSCPACAVLFAIPAELHLRRAAESGSVSCPNGHGIALSPVPPVELHSLNASLLEQLARVSVRPPTKPDHEAKPDASSRSLPKRAAFMARKSLDAVGGAGRGKYCNCLICNARVYFNAIGRHYQKTHVAELLALPAEAFEA